MTSKLAVLTLTTMLVSTSTIGASWVNTPIVHNDGLLIVRMGSGTECWGEWETASRYRTSWSQTYKTPYCRKPDRYQTGRVNIHGPCNIRGTWSFDGTYGRIDLNGYIWNCAKSGFFFGDNGTNYGDYQHGSGNWGTRFGLNKNTVTIGANPNGRWSTEILTLEGANLKQVTIVSNRDVNVNLGDEELTLREGITSEIPPPRSGNGYISTLKLYFHGVVTDIGTTTYNINLNATFI